MRRNVIAMIAGCAAVAALPAAASAQNGFPDYRQAAADQYPAQPPPGTSGSSANPSTAGSAATGGSSGGARPVHTTHGGKKSAGGSGTGPANAGGTAPVAVPSRPVPAAKGSLPFTGSDLSGLVVLALILIAAGFLLAAAARATRRRRQRAPA